MIFEFNTLEGGVKKVQKIMDSIYSKGLSEAALMIGKNHEKNLKVAMLSRGLYDTGEIFDSIGTIRKDKNTVFVTLSQEGQWVDSAPAHFVTVTKDKKIYGWAMRKGSPYVQAVARRGGPLWVAPTPFIYDATARTEAKIDDILNSKIGAAINSS